LKHSQLFADTVVGMSVSADIEQFILSELTQGRGITEIDPSENLLSKGIVDSHGVMELVGFLEERYGISVGDEDLSPENFESLASIEAFVARKNGQT
jgi:acyl carrier protein